MFSAMAGPFACLEFGHMWWAAMQATYVADMVSRHEQPGSIEIQAVIEDY